MKALIPRSAVRTMSRPVTGSMGASRTILSSAHLSPGARRLGAKPIPSLVGSIPSTKNARPWSFICRAEPEKALWLSAVSEATNLNDAIEETYAALMPRFEAAGTTPQIAIVFLTTNFKDRFNQVTPWLKSKLPSLQFIVGSTGSGVAGMTLDGTRPTEIERRPAFSLTLAHLPDTEAGVFIVNQDTLPDLDGPVDPWIQLTGIRDPTAAPVSFVLLSDPFFQGLDGLLSGLDYAFPNAVKVGGLSSAAFSSDRRALLCSTFEESGTEPTAPPAHGPEAELGQCCVGMWLQGAVQIQPIIAQGCRPLTSDIYTVAEGRGNQIHEIEDASGTIYTPFELIRQIVMGLASDDDRAIASRNLMVAIAPDDFKETKDLGQGDFLVRMLLGGDRGTGAMAVGDTVRKGMRIRFVVRDRLGALSDMEEHAIEYKRAELMRSLGGGPTSTSTGGAAGAGSSSAEAAGTEAIGALMFSCNGRGQGLFAEENVDSTKLHSFLNVHSAGFFCNGEIGPVGQMTYLHGFTCSVGVVRAPKGKGPVQTA